MPVTIISNKVTEGVIGLAKNDAHITDVAFDILSLEAVFLLPRVCALLSLIPFFGTLVSNVSTSSHHSHRLTVLNRYHASKKWYISVVRGSTRLTG